MTTKTGVFKSYKVFGKSRFFAVLLYFLEHICFRISVNLEEMSPHITDVAGYADS